MKKLFLLLVFASYGFASYAFSAYDAKQIAQEFYENMKILCGDIYPNHMANDKSEEAMHNIKELFLDKTELCRLPDEVLWLKGEKCKAFAALHAYLPDYRDYVIANGHIDFLSVDFGECSEIEGVRKKGDLSSNNFYSITVKKSIKSVAKSGDFKDIITIDTKSGKIVGIGNELGGYNPQSYSGNNYYMLMAKAAKAYDQKEYDLAYDTYLKIIKTYPGQCDPYYRLALMIYFKKGVKGRFKSGSERKQALRSYLRKAMSTSSGRGDVYKDAYNLEYTLDNALV